MRRLRRWFIFYEALVWFKTHPITGPVADDDSTPVIYPTWTQAFYLACYVARWSR